jgi:hypothetical protein
MLRSVRRLTLADLRSATGLVIGLYVTMHLSNHALGLISVRAQEAVRPWVMALWHSPPGQVLLYGSLGVHAAVALIVLFRRRHFYMPAWEATQILLGLAIPYLLLVHIVNTRGTRILTGIDIDYTYEIANLWGRSVDTSSVKLRSCCWCGDISPWVCIFGGDSSVGIRALFQPFLLRSC